MKTKEELNALKEEVKTLNKKPHELNKTELNKVSGGDGRGKSYTFRSGEIYHHTPYFYEVMYDHSGDENSYVYVWRYRRNDESNKEYFAVKAIELASYYQYQ